MLIEARCTQQLYIQPKWEEGINVGIAERMTVISFHIQQAGRSQSNEKYSSKSNRTKPNQRTDIELNRRGHSRWSVLLIEMVNAEKKMRYATRKEKQRKGVGKAVKQINTIMSAKNVEKQRRISKNASNRLAPQISRHSNNNARNIITIIIIIIIMKKQLLLQQQQQQWIKSLQRWQSPLPLLILWHFRAI